MSDTVTPSRLVLDKDRQLQVTWSDGKVSTYTLAMLRKNCPCAACKVQRENPPKTRLNILPGDHSGPLRVVSAEQVGNYAIRLNWSDKHASGIYSFTYLREISPA